MAKFLQRLGTKKEKHLIELTIISIQIPVKELVKPIFIEWKRGDKRDTSKTYLEIDPARDGPAGNIKVNETFKKLSQFYHSEKKDSYFKKMVSLKVKNATGPLSAKLLGEIDFDIAPFVGLKNHHMNLILKHALPNSSIELVLSISPSDASAVGSDSEGEEDVTVKASLASSDS